jgi:hypothetical protein
VRKGTVLYGASLAAFHLVVIEKKSNIVSKALMAKVMDGIRKYEYVLVMV